MEALLTENGRVNAIATRLDIGERVNLYSKPSYQQANMRLKALIADYDDYEADDFLTCCSHYVMPNS